MKSFTHQTWFILLLIILFNSNAFVQQTEDEKLLTRISQETNDTSRIKLMVLYLMHFAPIPDHKKWYDTINKLSRKYKFRQGLLYQRLYEGMQLSEQGKFDEVIARVKSCIDGLDSMKVIEGYTYPLDQLRFIYNVADRPIEMFRFYQEKIIFYRRYGPIENTAACYHSLGNYYESLADYDRAIGYFMRALEVYRTFDPMGVMNETMAIGFAYLDWGNTDKAELYLKTELVNQMREYPITFDYFDILGGLYSKKEDYKRALQYYLEQKKTILKMHNFRQANNILNIASAFLHLGICDSARFYLEGAERIRQKERINIYFMNSVGDIDYGYYEYYYKIGNQKNALQYLEKALQNAIISKDLGIILRYTNELHSFFLKKGDSLQALRYLIRYSTLQDSISTLNTKARIASFEIEQQAQLKENEIEQLKMQKQHSVIII